MNDPISRQAAIDAVADLYWMDERLLNFKKEIDKVYDKILNLPSAQQEPKRGKWIEGKYMGFDGCFVWHRECSLCGYEREDDNPDKDTPFCPICGHPMERSEDED